MKTRKCLASITTLALVLTMAGFSAPPKAQALTTEVTFELITKGSSGVGGDLGSWYPSVSADGTRIVFESLATDLIAGMTTNNNCNIFLYDTVTATTTLVTTGSSGTGGNNQSDNSKISPDGTKIVFRSEATDLITGMTTTGRWNIFLYDIASSTTTLISTGSSGTGVNRYTDYPSFSPDGTMVVFVSAASDLIPGLTTNNNFNIFLYEIASATTRLVTTGSSGVGGNNDSNNPLISADGTKIVFYSNATDLIAGMTTYTAHQIFLFDIPSSSTTLITAGSSGIGANISSQLPSVSADGTMVAFSSFATDLVPGVTFNFIPHVYFYNAVNNTMTLVSAGSSGFGGDDFSESPLITADGTKIVFYSGASDLIEGFTTNNQSNIYLYDTAKGTMMLITAGSSGIGGNGNSYSKSITADGTKIALNSNASNLIPGMTTYSQNQIFLATLTTYASVTFDPSNGEVTTAEKTVLGTAVDKPADPVREGFAFKGWFTSAGVMWDFDDPVDDDMTLTARWAQLFTVTFDPDNDEPIFTEKVPDGEAVNEPAEPVKEDFIFEGWFASEEVMWDFDDAVVEDITLVAHWVADEEPVVPEGPDEPDEPEEPEGPGVPEGPDGPEGPDEPGIPQTGDMLLLMSIAFMALVGGAMGTIAILRKRRITL